MNFNKSCQFALFALFALFAAGLPIAPASACCMGGGGGVSGTVPKVNVPPPNIPRPGGIDGAVNSATRGGIDSVTRGGRGGDNGGGSSRSSGGGYSGGAGEGGGDGVGDGGKAATYDPSSQGPPMDQYASGPPADTSDIGSDASVGSSGPTTSTTSVGGSAPTTSPQDRLQQLYAEDEKLKAELAAKTNQVNGLLDEFKKEQATDKDILGKPGSDPGDLDYIPTFSGWTSPTVDPLNKAIDERNALALKIKAHQQAIKDQRQAIYGKPTKTGFLDWLRNKFN